MTELNAKREKQQINIVYMWHIEKWYRWTYLQSRDRDIDVDKQLLDTKGVREEWDEFGDWKWHVYTTMNKIDN